MMRPETLLLLFVLVFSPLAFGTVEPWSNAVAGCAALAGLALALHRRTREGRLTLHAVPGILPLLLFLGFLLLQCIPLPPWLLHLISPAAHTRWEAALGGTGPLPWLPISLDQLATLREFFRFCSCAALYALTVQLLSRHERLRAVTTALAIFATCLAFEAILQSLIAPRSLLFVRVAPSHLPFGPFVNRNHFANLMAMLAPILFALFLGRGSRARARNVSLRGRLVDFLARPEASVRLLLGFAALLCAASIVISLSRGGIVAGSAALLVFGILLGSFGFGRWRLFATAAFFLALATFVSWFGWGKIAARFASSSPNAELIDSMRTGLWQDALRMAADFPVLGAGIGSFERLYPMYRTVPGDLLIAHAHSDYLELLAGGGVVGIGFLGWFVSAVLLSVVRTCRERRDRSSLLLAFGSVAGCFAFLVHGTIDFSLAIGANALYFFFLLGFAVSAAHTRGQSENRGTLLDRVQLSPAVSRAIAVFALASALWHAADLAALRSWRLANAPVLPAETLRVPPAGARPLVERAMLLQPFEAAYPAALARIAARDGSADEALRLTRRALRLRPTAADVLMQLGTFLDARHELVAARKSFIAALAADPASSRHRETFGAWLLARGELVEAAAQLGKALALEPARAPRIISLLVLAGFSDDKIAVVIPPVPEALLAFARYATTTGRDRLATEAYRRVLALDPGNRQAIVGLGVAKPAR